MKKNFVLSIMILSLILVGFIFFKSAFFCNYIVSLENGGLHVEIDTPSLPVQVCTEFGRHIWAKGSSFIIVTVNLAFLFGWTLISKGWDKEKIKSSFVTFFLLNTIFYLILITVMLIGIQPAMESVKYAAESLK